MFCLLLYAPFKSLSILVDTGIARNFYFFSFILYKLYSYDKKKVLGWLYNLRYNDALLLLSVIAINNTSYYHNGDPNRDWIGFETT